VVLYGIILSLAIWGLVANGSIKFSSIIVPLNLNNIINLISIAVFESTLLLIPPAIISLYYLMRILFFNAKIKIKSKIRGAKILVSQRYGLEEEVDQNSDNCKDTGLTTSNVILLPEGKYLIRLQS
jgi:hypothetical protein